MAEYIFVRRTTAYLLLVIATFSCVCLGLLIALLRQSSTDCRSYSGQTTDSLATSSSDVTPSTTNSRVSTTTQKPISDQTQPTDEVAMTTNRPPDNNRPWQANYRIPNETYALNYKLLLHPDLDSGLFSGNVEILISVADTRSYLVVHSKHLDIKSTQLYDSDSKNIEVQEAFEYAPNEFWVVRTPQSFGPGNYTLALRFEGNLTRGIVGLYRSVYTDTSTGEKRYIATSKFQPTFARRAFPCFDEPSFKSTFEVSLVRPNEGGYIALSNMPAKNIVRSQNFTTVIFEKSVAMVTYLACFIVCDFKSINTRTARGLKFRVFAAEDRADTMMYASRIGSNITDYFEQYFNISYPLPKQDMIAIPDFVSGAMEHWGLITYRESNLMYSANVSSSYNQQRVATVISHELAHQWFGNLVTLQWWNDLWLNEGFASYIEYKGVSHVHPDWNMTDQFLCDDMYSVMQLDATHSSHPIVQPVDTPDQITAIFDRISYAKGAAILRMLEAFMGPSEFRRGIGNFLKRYAYQNAVTQNLWDELETVSTEKLPITEIMNTWTRQMGFPLLVANRSAPTAPLRLYQSRYLENPRPAVSDTGHVTSESPYRYRWHIPVTFVTERNQTVTQVWFNLSQPWIELPIASAEGWYKLNSQHLGYYRVNYDDSNWQRLSQMLSENHETLSASDRASLLSDAFAMAKAGHVNYHVPLRMTSYLRNDDNYVVWSTVADELAGLLKLLRSSTAYPLLREYVSGLTAPHLSRLQWSDSGSHLERRTRVQLLHLACEAGNELCLREARRDMTAWLTDSAEAVIPANLRSIAYSYGIRENSSAWDVVWQRYIGETNSQERNKLARALASVREYWILERFVELAKNESNVRSQDYFSVLAAISANPVGNRIVWDFFRREWQSYLVPRFSLNERYLGFLVPKITRYFTTQLQLDEIIQFFAKYPEAGAGERSRQEALEQTRDNIEWLRQHQPTIEKWLETEATAAKK